jgi:plasmid stabilization system protein ParE
MADVSFIRSHTQTNGKHIGDLLWWTLADAEIARAQLEAIWSAEGLSAGDLPEVPTPEKALRTAIRECQVGRHDHLLRLGKQDDGEVVYAVVLETRDGSGNVHHAQEARITLYRTAPGRLASDDAGHPLVAAVSTAYDRLLNVHTADDVRRAILRTLASCAAVTLRDSGGVYWVPSTHAGRLRSLQAAIARIGTSQLAIVPIHETAAANQELGKAARASIEEEIVRLREELESFLEGAPRVATLAHRLDVFNDLRSRAQLYHSVLRVQVDDLDAALAKLTLQVEGLLQSKAS